jgi:hypothetical protein
MTFRRFIGSAAEMPQWANLTAETPIPRYFQVCCNPHATAAVARRSYPANRLQGTKLPDPLRRASLRGCYVLCLYARLPVA